MDEKECSSLINKLYHNGIARPGIEREVANTFPMHCFDNWRPFNIDDYNRALSQVSMKKSRLYFHTPFCESRCRFCIYDVTVRANIKTQEDYIKSVKNQFNHSQNNIQSINSIYFGGGTPSYLEDNLFEEYLSLPLSIPREEGYSFNVEAKPGTLTDSKIEIMKRLGVNRISLGIQTLDDKLLKKLNRGHNSKDSIETINRILQDDLYFNTDLIYGFPNQSVEDSLKDLRKLIDLGVPEFTLYYLRINPKTGLRHFNIHVGNQIFCFSQLKKILVNSGYVQTRPIHFVKKDFVENSNRYGSAPTSDQGQYSQEKEKNILGGRVFAFGAPGAVSHIRDYLWESTPVKEYNHLVNLKKVPGYRQYKISEDDKDTRFFIDFIQSMKSQNIEKTYRSKRGRNLPEKFKRKINRLLDLSLFKKKDKEISLTEKGFLVHDMIERFFL